MRARRRPGRKVLSFSKGARGNGHGTPAVAMPGRQDPLESTKVQAPKPWLL
jgi:hypothetical protein